MPFFKHNKKEIMEKYECDENLVPILNIVENSIEMDFWLNKFNLYPHSCWNCMHKSEKEINNILCLWCEKRNHKINYSRDETCKSWE